MELRFSYSSVQWNYSVNVSVPEVKVVVFLEENCCVDVLLILAFP